MITLAHRYRVVGFLWLAIFAVGFVAWGASALCLHGPPLHADAVGSTLPDEMK